jgi:hypothetical protein
MGKARANLLTVGVFLVLAGTVTAVRTLFVRGPWEIYTAPDRLLSIRFPKQPKESDDETTTPDGPVRTWSAGYRYAAHEYNVTVVRLPATGPFDAPTLLANAKRRALENVGGTASEDNPIEVDGIEGIEIEYMGPSPRQIMAYGRMRLFVSSTPRAVVLVNVMRESDIADPDALRFLQSMHLGMKVESE